MKFQIEINESCGEARPICSFLPLEADSHIVKMYNNKRNIKYV